MPSIIEHEQPRNREFRNVTFYLFIKCSLNIIWSIPPHIGFFSVFLTDMSWDKMVAMVAYHITWAQYVFYIAKFFFLSELCSTLVNKTNNIFKQQNKIKSEGYLLFASFFLGNCLHLYAYRK